MRRAPIIDRETSGLPVDLTAMRHAQNQHRHFALAKLVDDPVVSLTHTPEAGEFPLQTRAGGRILCEAIDPLHNTTPGDCIEPADGPQHTTLDQDRVTQTSPPPN